MSMYCTKGQGRAATLLAAFLLKIGYLVSFRRGRSIRKGRYVQTFATLPRPLGSFGRYVVLDG